MKKDILFLCIYPENQAPSQRFRFEQFFPYFKEANISFETDCFYSTNTYERLLRKGNLPLKAWLVFVAYFSRLVKLKSYTKFEYIFIQRGASPIGPPIFEYILSKIFKKKLVYDFDDAIWMPQDGKGNKLMIWLKNYGKVARICRISYRVITGNDFLANYARQFTDRVIVIPTVVDTKKKYNILKQHVSHIDYRVGWTGSYSTIRYLLQLEELLNDEGSGIRYVIIADRKPENLKNSNVTFVKWVEENEINDLLEIDSGIMPLVENDWTRGKCGFKAIQYMALGIPALVSPVGVNAEIVDDGINGFVCDTIEEWKGKIMFLKENPVERAKMGKEARKKIESFYSIDYAFPLILAIVKPGTEEDD